jgi:hypothetical protein
MLLAFTLQVGARRIQTRYTGVIKKLQTPYTSHLVSEVGLRPLNTLQYYSERDIPQIFLKIWPKRQARLWNMWISYEQEIRTTDRSCYIYRIWMLDMTPHCTIPVFLAKLGEILKSSWDVSNTNLLGYKKWRSIALTIERQKFEDWPDIPGWYFGTSKRIKLDYSTKTSHWKM